MRILYYSSEFGPGTGGIGQYMYQMAKAIVSEGLEVVVVTMNDGSQPHKTETDHGTIYRVYEHNHVRSAYAALKVLDIAKKHDVDCVEGSDHWGECAEIIKQKNRPPVIIKLHSCLYLQRMIDANVIYRWQGIPLRVAIWRSRLQLRAEKHCVEHADALLSPSKATFLEYTRQGASLIDKQCVIPNLLTTLPQLKNNSENSSPTLLYVGRIEALKGIQYFPEIMREVCKHYPDTVLEIAGSDQYARGIGSMKAWLKSKFQNQQSRVRFLGMLQPEELERAYRRCWMLVFPTKWDSFGMAVLEAMSYGKPVVTTPNGGMPEILSGTGAPIHLPDSADFAQSIVKLIADSKLRKSIGESCRNRVVSNYLPDKIIPRYLDFLQSNI